RGASSQYGRVVSQHRQTLGYFRFCLSSGYYMAPPCDPGLPERAFGMRYRPVCEGHESHSGYRRPKLQGNGTTGCTGANHSNADRTTRELALLKCGINVHEASPAVSRAANYDPVQKPRWRPAAIEWRRLDRQIASQALQLECRTLKSYSTFPCNLPRSDTHAHSAGERRASDRFRHSTPRRTICRTMAIPV